MSYKVKFLADFGIWKEKDVEWISDTRALTFMKRGIVSIMGYRIAKKMSSNELAHKLTKTTLLKEAIDMKLYQLMDAANKIRNKK